MHAKVTITKRVGTEALELTFTIIFPVDVDSEEVSYTLTLDPNSSTITDDNGLRAKMAFHGITFYRSVDKNRLELFSAVYELQFSEQGHEMSAKRFTIERCNDEIVVEGSIF